MNVGNQQHVERAKVTTFVYDPVGNWLVRMNARGTPMDAMEFVFPGDKPNDQ